MDRRGVFEAGAVGLPESPIAVGEWTPEQVLAALPVMFETLARAPWWQYAEPDLIARVQLMGRVENQAAAVQVAGVGEALGRGVLVGSGFTSGGAWLRGQVALTPHAASQRAYLAEQLVRPDLAPTKDAFTAGR